MNSRWGTYPWFLERGVDKIHPDDLENFKKETNNCKAFECIGEDDDFIAIKYNDRIYQVKADLFKTIPAPYFNFGQKVKLKNSDDEAVITDIMWHSTNQEHYYFLIVNSKKKSKRYLESEFLR